MTCIVHCAAAHIPSPRSITFQRSTFSSLKLKAPRRQSIACSSGVIMRAMEPEKSIEMEPLRGSDDEESVTVAPTTAPVAKLIYGELVAISLVYFSQGVTESSFLALSYYLKDNLGLGPAQTELLLSFSFFPWVIKPLYGFISDSFPIFGYRRRSYLILCGIFGGLAWAILGVAPLGPAGVSSVAACMALASAYGDVVIDSIVAQRAKGESLETGGTLQSLSWSMKSVGGIISSYVIGVSISKLGPRSVFFENVPIALMTTLSGCLVVEKRLLSPRSHRKTERDDIENPDERIESFVVPTMSFQFKTLWKAFFQRQIFFPALFMFIYMASPNVSSAMFFFETNELGFSPEFMGTINGVGEVAHLIGIGIFYRFLKSTPLKKLFFWTCMTATIVGLSQLILVTRLNTQIGLSDELFVLGDSVVLRAIGRVAFMPVLVLAARVCPEGVEATLFALLMSVLNFGGYVSQTTGALLTKMLGVTEDNFSQLDVLVTISVLTNLVPILFLNLIPNEEESSKR